MSITRSSDFHQQESWKRVATHPQDLPVASDFGDAPYPIICSCWDDIATGKQFIFSTYDGVNVDSWVAIGVNKNNDSLSYWQSDGNYKQVISNVELNQAILDFSNTLNKEIFVNTVSSGGNVVIDITEDGLPIFNSVLFVDIKSLDENNMYSFGTPVMNVDTTSITVPIRQLSFNGTSVLGIDVVGSSAMVNPSSPVNVSCKITGIRYSV